MCVKTLLSWTLGLLLAGELATALRAADHVIITEFMAVNDTTLADENGNFPDWIEIYNAGTSAVNLNGWFLTDSPGNPTKWRFPVTNLNVNTHLIVFASGDDRKITGRTLHTNFRLDGDTGYLALVKPDGTNLASAHAYTAQVAGISYGFPARQVGTNLVAAGASARFLVPANDSLAQSWVNPSFADGAWTPATLGVGYESAAPVQIAPVQIADSAAEFSGTQGGNGWFYGYWDRKADADGYYDPSNFTQFPRLGAAWSTTNFWTGAIWDWFNGNPPWTELTSTGGHPAGDNGVPAAAIHWAIRRYVCESNGPVRLTGTLACSGTNGTCGDGVIGRIYVDGAQVFAQPVFNTSIGYSLLVPANIGSIIDFVIDPGAANNGSCDSTTFTTVIRTAGGATPVADSMAEWSYTGTQGEKSWFYGYYNRSNDTVAGYQASNFVAFPSGGGPQSAANFWNGESWDWFEGDPPWTEVGQVFTYPNILTNSFSDKADEHWTVRRWVSEVSGTLIVDWHLAKRDVTGGGVTGTVYQNGVSRDTATVGGADFAGVTRTITIANVAVGDFIDFTVAPGADAIGDGSFLNAVIHGTGNLSNQITSNLEAAMRNVNSTLYLRVPFTLDDPSGFNALTLGMKFDDGFLAYLNGVQIATRNAPLSPQWNDAATAARPDVDATQFEEFNLTNLRDLLQTGANVLAIHGLNASVGDGDFLLLPELRAARPLLDVNTRHYFSAPTPGFANGTGNTNLGPVIVDIKHTPDMPADNQDLVITARVRQTFNNVTNVTLRYRVMYAAETSVLMLDDGAHGDGAPGDGVYGATIPNNLSTNGQMVRYYVTATDSNNKLTRQPPYEDTVNSSQYFGTVVANPALTNQMPVLHWFIQNAGSADSDAGSKASIYFLGEFYDNVSMNLHGQSSRGFPKKSYDIDFNPDHHFLYDPNERRVDDVNMLNTYPDKAHMRNMLSYETHRDAGPRSPYHWVVPVRVQTNSTFCGDWHLVENGDDNYIRRIGRDRNGALYKIYNTDNSPASTPAHQSTVDGAEKKTRRNENKDDLTTLLTTLGAPSTGDSAARRNYLYDNVDVSEVANMLAAMFHTGNIDCCHKNYYVYRDTEGDGEWEMMPWDVDLSFGRNWRGACSCYWDDQMYWDNDLFVGGNARVPGAIFNTPALRQMYLRRVRTLMDTLLQPTNTPPAERIYEKRIDELVTFMAPDAALDLAKWGTWATAVIGPIPTTDPNYQSLRHAADIIKTNYLPQRRNALFTRNSAIGGSSEIPNAQPTNVVIFVNSLEFNPPSGNQAEEYIELRNTNTFSVDISGWKLSGAVQHTFQGGVVLVANSSLYVAPNKRTFRARATGPRGGQGLYIEGPYDGQLSARGEPIILTDTSGRGVTTNNYTGNPTPAQLYLRVTEIMYHPPIPPPGGTNAVDDFEYLELKNIGPTNLNLTGVHFRTGIEFSFTGSAVTNLGPGQTVLIVKNLAAFTARYGGGFNLAGEYIGFLDNGGENLSLYDAVGEKVQDFTFDNDWYPITAGPGASLVIIDDTAPWDSWDLKASWRASARDFGSPGQSDPVPTPFVAVRVNEVLTHTDDPLKDSVELYNPTGTNADLGGWFLTDDFTDPKKFRVPNGTVVAAGGYLVFNETNFNPNPGVPPSFSFSAKGDEAYLFSGDGTNITGYFHGYTFGAAENGVSFGPYVTSQSEEHFVAMETLTLGATNSGPKVGPLVINEIMYHPPDLAGGVDNQADEFIELFNITGATVSLFDTNHSTNTWRLRSAVDFDFPPGITLAVSNYLLIVSFDPTNTGLLTAFRSKFGVPAMAQVLGPYSGKLDNSGGSVRLYKPDSPEAADVPYVLVDRVDYADVPPWRITADGLGSSLQREISSNYGNDPVNWIGAGPSAGAPRPAGTPPTITMQPADATVIAFNPASLTVSATGTPPLTYLWRKGENNVAWSENPTLTFASVQPGDAGTYSVVVINSTGDAQSSNATLTVLIPASITAQPATQTIVQSNNVTFTVAATSTTPITYQWRYNSAILPNATNTSLTISNVQPSDAGNYDVVLTDGVGPVTSVTAVLTVIVRPTIQQHPTPTNQVVVVGGTATLTMSVSNNATLPMSFRWRRGGTSVTNIIINSHTCVLTLPNIQAVNGGTWTCVPTNLAGTMLNFIGQAQPGLSLAGVITVITPVAITLQPTNRVVDAGSNVTFNAAASGTAPIGYQWWFNGTNRLANATNTSLNLTNVQLSNDGAYTLVATNAGSAATSQVAYLTILVPASIVTQPTNQTTTLCSNAALYVEATGGGPLRYQWYFNETNALLGATNNCLLIAPPGLASAGGYRVVVSNVLNAVTSQVATLTVTLGDCDGDGMPDEWELANGLNPRDGGDRDTDADNDGLKNWQEHVAGTNPQDAGSYLKIDQITAGGSATIWFNAVSNKTYTVQYNDTLPSVDWHKLGDVEAAPTNRPAASVFDPTPSTSRAYRLVTPKQ